MDLTPRESNSAGGGHWSPAAGEAPRVLCRSLHPVQAGAGPAQAWGVGARGHLQTEGCGHGEPQAKQAVPRWAGQGPVQVTPTDGFRDNTGNALVTSADKPSWQAVMGAGGWVVA